MSSNMTPNRPCDPPYPSNSSPFSPFSFTARRGSVASISSRKHLDKEVLDHALDEIHTSASRSGTLTTFNDFAAPPPPAPSRERNLASPFAYASLDGVYARFKSSIGAGPGSRPTSSDRPSSSNLDGTSPSTPFKGPNQPQEAHSKSAKSRESFGVTETSPSPSGSSSARPAERALPRALSTQTDSSFKVKDAFTKSDVDSFPANDQLPMGSLVPDEPSSVQQSTAVAKDDQSAGKGRTLDQTPEISHLSRPSSDISRRSSFTTENLQEPDQPFIEGGSPGDPPPKLALDTSTPRAGSVLSEHGSPADMGTFQKFHSRVSSSSQTSHATKHHSPKLVSPQPQNPRAVLPGMQQQANPLLSEMRRKVLSRDFWMKDENAKVCFNCGESFTTFRRKHHCRTCGQIYDAKCTVLISGKLFDQPGHLRICKTCENIIIGDDSSEYSSDDEPLVTPATKQIRFSALPTESRTSLIGTNPSDDGRPSSQGSASRMRPRSRDSLRRSTAATEEDFYPVLSRPHSSRSLKSLGNRPRSTSQRFLRSRHQHMRSLGMVYDNDSFQSARSRPGTSAAPATMPGLHHDSIIDPDLAPFMSDPDSSEDEQNTSLSRTIMSKPGDQHVHPSEGRLNPPKRQKSRPLSRAGFEASPITREPEMPHLTSNRSGHRRRLLGPRTLSTGSLIGRIGMSPGTTRSENFFTTIERNPRLAVESHAAVVPSGDPNAFVAASRPTDLEPPAAELNRASLDHVKRLLRQFLRDLGISSWQRWQTSLIPVLLQCAEEVDPNIHRGDDIDIRHYVKFKKAPGGKPSDIAYVSGVVFTKHLALKSMRRKVNDARILLISFPLIYARRQVHFMSLEPVIAQEKEYLRNLVRRIVALGPDVVLVQRDVSGLALQYLQEANITVASNVKETVMQAISRCAQSRIISSVDKLTMDPKFLGYCYQFEAKSTVHNNVRKNYIYVSGCQKDLGCTIVLRGAELDTLVKLKWITEFMCYVVYNLKLETSLIRDQFMSVLPADLEASSLQVLPQRAFRSTDQALRSSSTPEASKRAAVIRQFNPRDLRSSGDDPASEKDLLNGERPECSSLIEDLRNRVLSVSPAVKLPEPYLLQKGHEQEEKMLYLKDQIHNIDKPHENDEGESGSQNFELVKPEMVAGTPSNPSQQLKDALRAIRRVEYDKSCHQYAALKRRWHSYVAGALHPFSPMSHQQIVVLFTITSRSNADACEGPDLLGLDFYQEHETDGNLEPDMPLGEYIERLCQQAEHPCIASRCDKSMIDHYRQYVHGDGQITISTEKHAPKIRGLRNTILMWSFCKGCSQDTPVTPMSINTWKYSFAKYLELSSWSRSLRARAGFCSHDVQKDHIRYFGFRDLAVRVHYEPINILEVLVPRGVVSWKVEKDIAMKNVEYIRIEERLSRFMASVQSRVESIRLHNVEAEKVKDCENDIANFKQRVKAEHEILLEKLREKYTDSRFYEIIPLNRAVRAIQEKVAGWDVTFAEFEKNYFPSEKDIRRLAAERLKELYLESEQASQEQDDEKDLRPVYASEKVSDKQIELEGVDLSSKFETPPSHKDLLPAGGDSSLTATLDQSKEQTIENLDLALAQGSPINRRSREYGEKAWSRGEEPHVTSDQSPVTSPEGAKDAHSTPTEAGKATEKAQVVRDLREALQSPRRKHEAQRSQGSVVSPTLRRSQTQPTKSSASQTESSSDSTANAVLAEPAYQQRQHSLIPVPTRAGTHGQASNEPKSLENVLAQHTKGTADTARSLIPQPVNRLKANSRVSILARHFEQLSKEFERQRIRERRQWAAKVRQTRVHPTASFEPVVEVFRDAHEAVQEQEPSIQGSVDRADADEDQAVSIDQEFTSPSRRAQQIGEKSLDGYASKQLTEDGTLASSISPSDLEESVEDMMSDKEAKQGYSQSEEKVDPELLSPADSQAEFLEIPKHDKNSIMKLLTSFWSERTASGWTALEYPLIATDHIFADSDIIVREDEPSSLIAFALASSNYTTKIQQFRERVKGYEQQDLDSSGAKSPDSDEGDVERILLGNTATHMKYQFQAGSSKMQCKIFFAESFDAIRQKCGVSERFVESLSRSLKWDTRGGKTKSLFLRTLDERFVVKSLSAVETQAFLKFAPDYFDYMSKCLFHSLPSALAKMLGFYQVVIKNPVTGVEFNYFLQVMENVFYEGPSNRMFDLKGSMRNRKVETKGEKNEVLLDENLLDYISQSPVYVRNHCNSLLASSITNDTLFCSKQNVMDYSLIVGLYDDRQELMVGIIDYIRTYTWDKKLESWIKDRGKHKPTVRSPKEYRNRFRASISRYFPLAPSCWQIFGTQRTVWDDRFDAEQRPTIGSNAGLEKDGLPLS